MATGVVDISICENALSGTIWDLPEAKLGTAGKAVVLPPCADEDADPVEDAALAAAAPTEGNPVPPPEAAGGAPPGEACT